jgi:hypothetical protein
VSSAFKDRRIKGGRILIARIANKPVKPGAKDWVFDDKELSASFNMTDARFQPQHLRYCSLAYHRWWALKTMYEDMTCCPAGRYSANSPSPPGSHATAIISLAGGCILRNVLRESRCSRRKPDGGEACIVLKSDALLKGCCTLGY